MDYMPLLRPFTTEQLVRGRTYFEDVDKLDGIQVDALYTDGPCFVDRLYDCPGDGYRETYYGDGYLGGWRIQSLVAAAAPRCVIGRYAELRRDLNLVLAERGIPDGGKEVSPKEREYAAFGDRA